MNHYHFHLFDATLIAISLPTWVLCSLILISARDHKCFPWQRSKDTLGWTEPTQSTKTSCSRVLKSLAAESAVYLFALSIAMLLYRWCSSHFFWQFLIKPERLWLFTATVPSIMNMTLSACISYPVIAVLQAQLLRTSTGKSLKSVVLSGQFVFCVSVLTSLILPGLAFFQWTLAALGSSLQDFYVARELLRDSVALATIPMAISGIAVAFTFKATGKNATEKNSLALDSNDYLSLESKSDEELHMLVGMALKAKKLDVADKVSKHLLLRVEQCDEIE